MIHLKNFPEVGDRTDPDGELAAERVRVAHELHDGVIQTLIGINLRLSVLQRRPLDPDFVSTQLSETQVLVRRSIGDLRELILQIRPVSLAAGELTAVVAETVERFGRETGIRTQCTCNGTPPRIGPAACGQIVRIVQEALMNARRHSGASNVVVSLTCGAAMIHVTVDDDGQGFPFEGRWTHDELDRERRGPVVIKERVRILGGQLTIHSTPKRGARLEIAIPCADRG